MEFSKVISARRSIRKFKPDPIGDEQLMQLLEAGRLAPSGLNLQPWRYIIVKDKALHKKIAETGPSSFIVEAPVIIICCLDKSAMNSARERGIELIKVRAVEASKKYAAFLEKNMDEDFVKINLYMNAAISIEHILLKAVDLGLGACWIGSFDTQAVKELADLEDNYEVSAMIAVGVPNQNPDARPRLPMSEILLKII